MVARTITIDDTVIMPMFMTSFPIGNAVNAAEKAKAFIPNVLSLSIIGLDISDWMIVVR